MSKLAPERDRYDLVDAYRSVMLRYLERKKEQAATVTALLLGKNRCNMCRAFIDKTRNFCNDCIPF